MTDHRDHDDELGAFLRSEVPEPGAGYWDGIDAMLRRVEDERADDAAPFEAAPSAPETGEPGLTAVPPVTEESLGRVHTDENVIRLTDMTTNTTGLPARNRGNVLVLAAAALIAVLGLGAIFTILSGDPSTTIDADFADDGTPGPTTPAPDDGDDGSPAEGDGAATTDAVSPGSVWLYAPEIIEREEFPRPFLAIGDDAEPYDGQIWASVLIATGEEGPFNDDTWAEFDGLGQPDIWLPLSTLVQQAEGLPPVEPSLVEVIADTSTPPEAFANGVPAIGTVISSTGIRAEFDGEPWILIDDPDFPYFIEESVVAATSLTGGNVGGRRCYSDGVVTYTFEFSADGGTFTGWQVPVGFADDADGLPAADLPFAPGGELLQTLSGVVTVPEEDRYQVLESSVAAEAGGFGRYSTSSWVISADFMTTPTAGEEQVYNAVGCDGPVADDLAPVEATYDNFPGEDVRPSTTAAIETVPGVNRSCYTDGAFILALDFTDDGRNFNAIQTGRVATFSGTGDVDGSDFIVTELVFGDQENGRVTIAYANWDVTPDRAVVSEIGAGAITYDGIDCAEVADDVTQAEDFLGALVYPTYPSR
ncbi:MAG: hypothetical protein AAF962_14565 [Actinomycetota bacterium]